MQKDSSIPFYDSARPHNVLDELIATLKYKDLIVHLVKRDLTSRYKRSALGVAWTMINPLGMMLILTFVFSQIFTSVDGYAAYILSGLLVWNFFSQSTVSGINSIVWGGALFRQIYMPRAIFAASAIGTAIVNMVISLVPYLLVSIIVGRYPTFYFLNIFIPIILLSLFSLGFSLIIASVGVRFPDVVEMYSNVVLLAWMYLTPIIYPLDILPSYALPLMNYNPMFHFVNLFRDAVFYGQWLSTPSLGISLVVSLSVFLVGWTVFSRITDEIAYHA